MRVVIAPVASTVQDAGGPVLRVTSINDTAAPVDWPVRLHPSESTVAFVVDGERVQGTEQIDSIVDTVTLAPGQAVSTGVRLAVDGSGVVAADAATTEVQIAVSPPGAYGEVLSNVVALVADPQGQEPADADTDAVATLDRLAWEHRDGETDGPTAVQDALARFGPDDRPWIATALLPAAPMADDVLLAAARRLSAGAEADPGADQGAAGAAAAAIVNGEPYTPD